MVESRHVVTSDELQCTAAHHYANTHGVKLRAALIAVLTPPTSLPQPSTTLSLFGPARHLHSTGSAAAAAATLSDFLEGLCTTCAFSLFWSCWSPVRTFYYPLASQFLSLLFASPWFVLSCTSSVSAPSSLQTTESWPPNLVHKIYSDLRPFSH
jgi:hypothetical protein